VPAPFFVRPPVPLITPVKLVVVEELEVRVNLEMSRAPVSLEMIFYFSLTYSNFLNVNIKKIPLIFNSEG
jgi:hypothetical protein